MKKILFNDRFSLTKAVLEGRKTMTRRPISERVFKKASAYRREYFNDTLDAISAEGALLEFSRLKVGEVVAVAQSLLDMGYDPRDTKHKSGAIWGLDHTPAWTNKMFVSASECIHQIRITNVRVERLQDISDEDCLKEGITKPTFDTFTFDGWKYFAYNPREAFAALIDKVSGKGTFESNPWVFVYEFELVK